MDRATGGGNTIKVPPEKLIAAAGGYDALVTELDAGVIGVLDTDFDSTGDDQLDAALSQFATRWQVGLDTLVQSQRARGSALHYFAIDFLGYDVDTAYAILTRACGLDLR